MHTRVYQSGRPVRHPKKHISWRKRIVSSSLLVLALYVAAVSWLVPTQAVAGTLNSDAYSSVSTKIQLAWPSQGQAAIGAMGYGVLAQHGSSALLPTASVIKLVTALAVLEKHPLQPGESGPTITISQQDFETYQWYIANHGSVVPVRVGQKLSEYQALQAALIRSANNMADSLAVWAFGSLPAYHDYATSMIKRLGLNDIVIGTDASGLNPSTIGSAADLVRLGEIVMKKPILAEIVNQKSATIPEIGTIKSTNSLLGTHGIVGIKTGTDYTDKGSYVFASRYQVTTSQSVMIIGSVLGAPSIGAAKQAAVELLESAKSNFAPRTLFKKGQAVGTFQAPWSTTPVKAVTDKAVTVLGWRGKPLHLVINLQKVSDSTKAGDTVGTITTGTGSSKKTVGTVVLESPLQKPSLWWRLTHPSQN